MAVLKKKCGFASLCRQKQLAKRFSYLLSFIKENEINWSVSVNKCVGLITDEAHAISGIHIELISKVRSVAPLVQWTIVAYRDHTISAILVKCSAKLSTITIIVLRNLIGFSTTYLCEWAFSTLIFFLNKYRNKLNIESDLRVKLSRFWLSRGRQAM